MIVSAEDLEGFSLELAVQIEQAQTSSIIGLGEILANGDEWRKLGEETAADLVQPYLSNTAQDVLGSLLHDLFELLKKDAPTSEWKEAVYDWYATAQLVKDEPLTREALAQLEWLEAEGLL